MRIYLVNWKKSSTFAARLVRGARCVFSEPPKPSWCGDKTPEIISKWKQSISLPTVAVEPLRHQSSQSLVMIHVCATTCSAAPFHETWTPLRRWRGHKSSTKCCNVGLRTYVPSFSITWRSFNKTIGWLRNWTVWFSGVPERGLFLLTKRVGRRVGRRVPRRVGERVSCGVYK